MRLAVKLGAVGLVATLGGMMLVAAITGSDGTEPGGPCAGTTIGTTSPAAVADVSVPTPTSTPPAVAAHLSVPATSPRVAPADYELPLAEPPAAGDSGGFDPSTVTVTPRPGGTYAGVPISADQMRMAQIIVAVAKGMGLTERAARIGLATAMQESTLNATAELEKFVGLFQQSPPADGIYIAYPRTDPAGASWMFFDQLRKRVPGYQTDPRTDYEISDVVQESGQPANVQQWEPMATALAAELWSGTEAQAAGAAAGAAQPIAMTGATAAQQCAAAPAQAAGLQRPGGKTAAWDPGNIISDAVFYDTAAMTAAQIDDFITTINTPKCPGENPWCLRNLRVSYPAKSWSDGYCQPIPAATDVTAGEAIAAASTACGINPRVMLVKLETESRGLDRSDASASSYTAAWGWNCPDAADGSAACSGKPENSGFANQLQGMAHTWARLKVEVPQGKWNYGVGTFNILWNTENTGCGSAPVAIKNVATASLYVYTPYQPNAASLAGYPGEGDACSSYGNRNFFKLFQKYFGDTGGGIAATTPAAAGGGQPVSVSDGGAPLGPVTVTVAGAVVTIPSGLPDVPAEMQGQQVTAPTAEVAAGIAAGMTWIGTPYSWGGGGGSGPTKGICGPNGAENDCNIIGFDCSGLTRYVGARWGAGLPQLSGGQRDPGHGVDWSQAKPGDVVGYDGHVTIYIGTFAGVRMQLEAPQSGDMVRISRVRSDADPSVYRYWGSATSNV